MDPKVIIVLSVSTMLVLEWYRRRRRIINSLRAYHGPPPPGFFGGNALGLSSTRDILLAFRMLHEEYGDIVKLSIGSAPTLLVRDTTFLSKFLRFSNDAAKKYKYLSPWLGTRFIDYGARCSLYSIAVEQQFTAMSERLTKTIGRDAQEFAETLQQDRTFNIYTKISLFALRTVIKTLTGVVVDTGDAATREYLDCVRSMCQMITQKAFKPILQNTTYCFCSCLTGEEQRCKEVIKNFINYIIEHKTANDFVLDELIEMEGTCGVSLEDIREELHNLIFFGHQTVTLAVGYALFCLSGNEGVQDTVYEELQGIFNRREQHAIFTNLTEMCSLDKVVNETLRLYPPVPFYFRTLEEDIVRENETLPKGVTLIVNIHGMQRKSEFFNSPDDFDPFETDRSYTRKNGYLPFSTAWNKTCIGNRFSIGLIKIILASIIRRYRILPAVPAYEPCVVPEIVLHPINGIHLRLQAREP